MAVHPVADTPSRHDIPDRDEGRTGKGTDHGNTETTRTHIPRRAARIVISALAQAERDRISETGFPTATIATINCDVLYFNAQFESSIFATTALVAMSGAAAADVALSGSAVAGLKNNGTDTTLHYEIDLDINFSGSTDNGLTFGASLELDEINTATTECVLDGTYVVLSGPPDIVNIDEEICSPSDRFGGADPEIFISGAFGTLTLGEVSPVLDNVGLADVGFDGLGVDDDLEALRDLSDSQNLTYVYEMSGFTFGLSYAIEGGTVDATEAGSFGVMFGYKADGFSGTIAYNDNDSTGDTAYGLRLGYSTDMFGVAAVYIDNSTGGQGYGLEGSYTLDDLKITAVFADDGGAQNDYGIGAAYDLGGSLGVAGGIASVDGTTVWDLGLTMKF